MSSKYTLWIVRLGRIFWALVEVAVPRSFPDLVFRHWLKLIYFLEVLLIAGSTLLISTQVQRFALTAFGITAAVHLAVVLLRDLIESKNRLINLAKSIGTVLLVTLIIIGGLSVSAVLGADFAWDLLWSVRTFVLSEADIGFNFKTLMRVLLILVVFMVFLWSIRKDLRALFRR